jgi:hypothetical protein
MLTASAALAWAVANALAAGGLLMVNEEGLYGFHVSPLACPPMSKHPRLSNREPLIYAGQGFSCVWVARCCVDCYPVLSSTTISWAMATITKSNQRWSLAGCGRVPEALTGCSNVISR